jgi:DNA polymerase-3 subunit alpha
MVQLAWQVHDERGEFIVNKNYIIKPEGFEIPYDAQKIHGISTERALAVGHDIQKVLDEFAQDVHACKYVVGHNVDFDISVVGCELVRLQKPNVFESLTSIDTMKNSIEYCKLPGGKGGSFKFPKLTELYEILFHESFVEAHNASADVNATARCFFEMIRLQIITNKHINDDECIKKFIQHNPTVCKLAKIDLQSNFTRLKFLQQKAL